MGEGDIVLAMSERPYVFEKFQYFSLAILASGIYIVTVGVCG